MAVKKVKERRQIAAMPLREREGQVEVCLVTTRTTKRWTVPKGWPMKGRKNRIAAKIEAREEAGVTGKPGKKPIGSFEYWKRLAGHFELVKVEVYVLPVRESLPECKEQSQRYVQWMSLEDAATLVDDPGLAALLLKYRNQLVRHGE